MKLQCAGCESGWSAQCRLSQVPQVECLMQYKSDPRASSSAKLMQIHGCRSTEETS